MKNALLPIVAAALLVSLPAAADAPEGCPSGTTAIAVSHGQAPARSAADSGCARAVKAQFRGGPQAAMSDKEIERALKRQGFRGRLVEMIPDGRGGNQVKVLWETQEAGKRTLRTLIVDAKTGKFIREERR